MPCLSAFLPGLRPDLPDLSAPLSGKHVPPFRRQERLLPRSQDGRRYEIIFSTASCRLGITRTLRMLERFYWWIGMSVCTR